MLDREKTLEKIREAYTEAIHQQRGEGPRTAARQGTAARPQNKRASVQTHGGMT
jgi:hypothetical protein